MVSWPKLDFYVCYEDVYKDKKFKTFNIKNLITIVWLKCKKFHKIGYNTLGVVQFSCYVKFLSC